VIDICPVDNAETYECPICGAEYRMCDEPECAHTDDEWRTYMDHVEAMESDFIGEKEA
jgi:hypothetical protein